MISLHHRWSYRGFDPTVDGTVFNVCRQPEGQIIDRRRILDIPGATVGEKTLPIRNRALVVFFILSRPVNHRIIKEPVRRPWSEASAGSHG